MKQKSSSCAPVTHFPFAALSQEFSTLVTTQLFVEARYENSYWYALVTKIEGYRVRLEWMGIPGKAPSWRNILNDDIHGLGWCERNGKVLSPPEPENHAPDEILQMLFHQLDELETFDSDFEKNIKIAKEHIGSELKLEVGMIVEAVDKECVCTLKPAEVTAIVGGRVQVAYIDKPSATFWAHIESGDIRPVGWARLHNRFLKSTSSYYEDSLRFIINETNQPYKYSVCSKPEHFPAFVVSKEYRGGLPNNDVVILNHEKLELVDRNNPERITVGTLRLTMQQGYLMFGIEGNPKKERKELMIYHVSSPYIMRAGYCKDSNLPLTAKFAEGDFKWEKYIAETKCKTVQEEYFVDRYFKENDNPFKVGDTLEAASRRDAGKIFNGVVKQVNRRLVRVGFEGFNDDHDQWFDYESYDLMPRGWCEGFSYQMANA